MKDLCDLVTVSREYKAMRERAVTEKTEQPDRTVLKYLGRRLCVMICESGNLLGKLVMSFRRKQNSKRSKSIIMLFQSEDRDCVSVVVSDF